MYGIPESSCEETLKSHFAAIGEVSRVKILPCREGKDTTLGFVHFTNEADCTKAANELNNQEFNGSQLRVQSECSGGSGGDSSSFGMNPSTFGMNGSSSNGGGALDERPELAPRFGGAAGGGRGPQAKIFGIPPDTDREVLKSHFAPAGMFK